MDSEKPARIRVVALTSTGAELAARICRQLDGTQCWLPARFSGRWPEARTFARLSDVIEAAFHQGEALVCVMAAGIVVRSIAPVLRGKLVDPPVVVVDETGGHAVSLLSGHLGGANRLARRVAACIGAAPVITTATDLRGLPALDSAAADLGLGIETPEAIRVVHAAMLEGEPVSVVDPEERLSRLVENYPNAAFEILGLDEALACPHPTVYAGIRNVERENWLILRPRNLFAGVGCNRGTSAEEILALIRQTFAHEGLSLGCLQALASIEEKSNEVGLLDAARELRVKCRWFSVEDLQEMEVPHPSEAVARHMGVASVCEAAALKAANARGLLVSKRKTPNATLAVAQAGSRS